MTVLWIIPIIALAIAGWIGSQAWNERGATVLVFLDTAHGLGPGDPVRYRGMSIGEVDTLELSPDTKLVLARVRLLPSARSLARDGTRFWIVHPRLGLEGASGLETIIGPRYLALLPGPEGAPARRRFDAQAAPPMVRNRHHGDLEIILEATDRSGLRPGARLSYRGIAVGTVLAVGLTSDGGLVEARVHVEQAYRGLIRDGSRFWSQSGLRAEIGLGGVSVETGSLPELLSGSIAFATPPADDAGDAVLTGHRFPLADEVDSDWKDWSPGVTVGSQLLPPGTTLPNPQPAVLAWRSGLVIKWSRSRHGWILKTDRGILGPADLLTSTPASRTDDETVMLEVDGQQVALEANRIQTVGALAWLDAEISGPAYAVSRFRSIEGPTEPEDAMVVAGATAAPLPLSAARLSIEAGRWRIDGAVAINTDHHGAPVVARADGAVIGIVLIDDDGHWVVPVVAPPEGGE